MALEIARLEAKVAALVELANTRGTVTSPMSITSKALLQRLGVRIDELAARLDGRPEEARIICDEALVQLLGWPDCVQPLVDAHMDMDAHSEDRAAKKVLVIKTGVERCKSFGKADAASIELARQLQAPLQIEHKPQPTIDLPQ